MWPDWTMILEAQWSHAKFSLVIHNNCSSFSFMFNSNTQRLHCKYYHLLDKVIENKFQKWVHTLRTDKVAIHQCGTTNLLQRRGITSSTSVAKSGIQWSCWEQIELTRGARKMLRDSDLVRPLGWGTQLTSTYHCCPSATSRQHHSIQKGLLDMPSISHLCIFGIQVLHKGIWQNSVKLDDKAKECRLVGYEKKPSMLS